MTEDQASLPSQPALNFNVEVLANPSQETLRELALEHTPHCFVTADGSINKVARNKARMAAFTYIIDRKGDGSRAYSHNVIEPSKAADLIAAQARYLEDKGKLIEIDAYVGMGPRAVPAQWLYTLEGANIAGMQQVLAFPRESVEDSATLTKPFAPAFRLIYTPNFRPPDLPQKRILTELARPILRHRHPVNVLEMRPSDSILRHLLRVCLDGPLPPQPRLEPTFLSPTFDFWDRELGFDSIGMKPYEDHSVFFDDRITLCSGVLGNPFGIRNLRALPGFRPPPSVEGTAKCVSDDLPSHSQVRT